MKTMMKLLMIVNDQGGAWIQCDESDISPTLRSQMKHHEPLVVLKENEDEDTDRETVL